MPDPYDALNDALTAIDELVRRDGPFTDDDSGRLQALHRVVRTYALATIAVELRELRSRGLDIRGDVNAWPAPTS